jgi:SAM-dependent methyltransferase
VSAEQKTLSLRDQFGPIDIYLFDQMLRGNITPAMRVLDAGCGEGRNLAYLLREGCAVFGIDRDAAAVAQVRRLAASLQPGLPQDNFQVGAVEAMPFAGSFADVVICSAVLHFARDERHFRAMVSELWRVLRPGGLLFCRLASRIGMSFKELRPGIFAVGRSEWFLADQKMLLECTAELGGTLVDPLKTTVVQDQRCMTTWVVRKSFQAAR